MAHHCYGNTLTLTVSDNSSRSLAGRQWDPDFVLLFGQMQMAVVHRHRFARQRWFRIDQQVNVACLGSVLPEATEVDLHFDRSHDRGAIER